MWGLPILKPHSPPSHPVPAQTLVLSLDAGCVVRNLSAGEFQPGSYWLLKVGGEATPVASHWSREWQKQGLKKAALSLIPQHFRHHCVFPIEISQLAVLRWQPLISEDKGSIDSNLSCIWFSLKLKIAFGQPHWGRNAGAMRREHLKLAEIILALL